MDRKLTVTCLTSLLGRVTAMRMVEALITKVQPTDIAAVQLVGSEWRITVKNNEARAVLTASREPYPGGRQKCYIF